MAPRKTYCHNPRCSVWHHPGCAWFKKHKISQNQYRNMRNKLFRFAYKITKLETSCFASNRNFEKRPVMKVWQKFVFKILYGSYLETLLWLSIPVWYEFILSFLDWFYKFSFRIWISLVGGQYPFLYQTMREMILCPPALDLLSYTMYPGTDLLVNPNSYRFKIIAKSTAVI
jgi:hypothetical protein